MEKVKIYFGAPLFSSMEQLFNDYVLNAIYSELIEKGLMDKVDFYVPQDNADINDKSSYADSIMIAEADTERLMETDILIAIMDGQVMDVGLASEIGVAYANKRTSIIGFYSDVRQGHHNNQQKIDALNEVAESQFSYINLYTVGLVKLKGKMVTNIDDLVDEVIKEVENKLHDNN